MHTVLQGQIPPSFVARASCHVLHSCLPLRSRAGWKPNFIFPLGNQPATGAPAGRVGKELLMAGGIYNLCLVPAGLDAHSRFPPYNKIKQLRDISSLLADEIPASASPLRPARVCSLFLHSKTWVGRCCCFFYPQMGDLLIFPTLLHFQSSWVRGAGGLGLQHLFYFSFIPSPTSEGPQ